MEVVADHLIVYKRRRFARFLEVRTADLVTCNRQVNGRRTCFFRGVVQSQIGCTDFKSSKNFVGFIGFFFSDFLDFFRIFIFFRIFRIFFEFFNFFEFFGCTRIFRIKKDLNTEIEGLFTPK